MLEGKVSPDKFSEAIDASNKLSAPELAQIPESKVSGKTGTSLRDSLRDSLAAKEKSRHLASESSSTATSIPTAAKISLSASSFEDALGSHQTQEQELTLFDVIHRKYLELQAGLKK
jgi:hypothetical protein